jgi:hypothetical protein
LEDKITPTGPMYPNLQVYQPDMPTGNVTVDANHNINFTTSLTNAGVGPFELRETNNIMTLPDGTFKVLTNQRVYNDDNGNGYYDAYNATTNPGGDKTYTDQFAGWMTYHPTHGHMHFDEFAIARLRLRPADNSVGAVIAVGPKTSFCLEDLGNTYPSLPGHPSSAVYSCSPTSEGISIGWRDIYSAGLEGQTINVSNIPNGNYWLEIECDYANQVQETNENDNISRSAITITNQPATGFMVLSATPQGAQQTPVSYVDFGFNQAVGSFPASAVTFTGPPGQTSIPISSVQMLDSAHVRVNFATQGAIGTYNMKLDPTQITNASGQKLDQNNNGVGGELGDVFVDIFAIPGPQIISVTPSGSTAAPVSTVQVTYNRPMNSATFNLATILSFNGPGGVNLLGTITGVTAVTSGGQSQSFNITFPSVSTPGAYVMVISPSVQDPMGNYVDQNNNGIPNEPADQYSDVFSIPVAGVYGPDTFGYTAVSYPYQTISMTSSTGITYTNTDDESQPLNLGTDTFNFYGTTYTGANSVYASTNALISFGAADANYNNDIGLNTLAEPAIAPLWDDWIIGSGNPQVRYLRRDTNGDGINDQLVIEWNQIRHYSTTSGSVTFEAILELNTGNRPGKIIFNYPNLVQGNPAYDNGAAATVGLRSNSAMNSTLVVSADSNSFPLVASNKAMLVSVPSVTSITRLDPNPAPDGIVHYQVTFSDSVTGVDPTDFTLTSTGANTGAKVIGVPASADGKTWQVNVDTGVGSGTLRLNLIDNDSIISISGAKLGGAGLVNGDFTAGDAYTIVQRPPQVAYVQYENGSAQRSRIDHIQVVFDHAVDFAGAPSAAFQVVGPNGPIALAVDTSLSTEEQTVAKLTFSGAGTEYGSLMDGNYTLTAFASQISTGGVVLDGNGDGTAGDDFGTTFYRLFGDYNGDRTVSASDFIAFRQAFGGTNSAFDFDGDGSVSANDFVQFQLRFGASI